jgi:hypothetical protein
VFCAGVAQLVEQRFCKPQVVGSSPFSSSIFEREAKKWVKIVPSSGGPYELEASMRFLPEREAKKWNRFGKKFGWRDTQVAKGIRL